ncbi:unnamed protein product [Clonostachys rhizophaga]|uniref:PiggyBac transposable element-derived protein domain-containing protein n=1 Tax=Clonostachys rhizophaga TaxID=160324 RepID=A0A9N9YHS0_9HYPO|nr:unnamed protein product [Clonostachys rhizophaga]
MGKLDERVGTVRLQHPDDPKESDTTDKAHNPQNPDDPDDSNVTDVAENSQDSQASKTITTSTRAWSPLTSAQIFIWLAILINMGISPKRSLADHWKTSQVGDIQPSDPFIKYMTFHRFKEILKYLRIFPPFEKIEDDSERMTFRVREWSDHIKTTSTSLFTGNELQDAAQRKKTESITKNRRKTIAYTSNSLVTTTTTTTWAASIFVTISGKISAITIATVEELGRPWPGASSLTRANRTFLIGGTAIK